MTQLLGQILQPDFLSGIHLSHRPHRFAASGWRLVFQSQQIRRNHAAIRIRKFREPLLDIENSRGGHKLKLTGRAGASMDVILKSVRAAVVMLSRRAWRASSRPPAEYNHLGRGPRRAVSRDGRIQRGSRCALRRSRTVRVRLLFISGARDRRRQSKKPTRMQSRCVGWLVILGP